jgi:anthranilate synthase component 1
MKKIKLYTTCKKILADVYTPVGIYLRLRDRFRDTILLESTDHHTGSNSWSFIGINAIGGIEVSSGHQIEFKLPGRDVEKVALSANTNVPELLWQYMQRFECDSPKCKEASFAHGLYGYTTYDAIQFFETIQLAARHLPPIIPLMRYRLYQYIIAIDHFRDELFICENHVEGIKGDIDLVETLIRNKDVPVYPFSVVSNEQTDLSDDEYMEMVSKGIEACHRGDVFQIVLSRRFQQTFNGDEFNVYRALRSVNPSPWLFYFDYGDYKLMGSSPESQLSVTNGTAMVHPIAGTCKRTGDEEADTIATEKLLTDAKENAEHVMLVDLARNDLSKVCSDVKVEHYRQVRHFSHVIHLVSEVKGDVGPGSNPFSLLSATFPAGTLSGAPKFKAMELIDEWEPTARSYYGGTIGFAGFNGNFNHAIMIRTFLSQQNTLTYQAGAGIVAASQPGNELEEVNNKLGALKRAIERARTLISV